MRKLLILLAIAPFCWSVANLSYVVNGSKDKLKVVPVEGAKIADLTPYNKTSTNYDFKTTGNDTVLITPSGLNDKIAILHEVNILAGRNGLLINSDVNNRLVGHRSYECYFYNGSPIFSLSYNVYSASGKNYYDYKFNYLPDLGNDVIYVNSDTSPSSTTEASVACNKMDDDIKETLGQTKRKLKHKRAK